MYFFSNVVGDKEIMDISLIALEVWVMRTHRSVLMVLSLRQIREILNVANDMSAYRLLEGALIGEIAACTD